MERENFTKIAINNSINELIQGEVKYAKFPAIQIDNLKKNKIGKREAPIITAYILMMIDSDENALYSIETKTEGIFRSKRIPLVRMSKSEFTIIKFIKNLKEVDKALTYLKTIEYLITKFGLGKKLKLSKLIVIIDDVFNDSINFINEFSKDNKISSIELCNFIDIATQKKIIDFNEIVNVGFHQRSGNCQL